MESKTLVVFATCSKTGTFNELLIIPKEQIVCQTTITNDDGTYYAEYGDKEETGSFYFLDFYEITVVGENLTYTTNQ